MKKALLTLSLLGLAGAAAFGVASFQNNLPLEVKAEATVTPDEDGYISVEALGFTNTGDNTTDNNFNGWPCDSSRTYWDSYRSHFALSRWITTGFSNGDQINYDNEGWRGTLRSKTWTQKTQYVYFQLGGAANEADHLVRLDFHVGGQTYPVYNDSQEEGRLILRHFEIPSEMYATLDTTNGFDMYVDIVDQRTNAWGLVNFGYLHVNQTKEQVGDAMRYYLNHMGPNTDVRETEVNARKAIQGHYFTNSSMSSVFFDTAANISDGFDSQSDFTKHWYFDHKYFNNNGAARSVDTAISGVQNHSNGTPYNMEGSGFFRGYLEGDGTGFMPTDESLYRFISRPFIVDSNNPYISIKMGGRASLHIIDATVNPGDRDDADLAWIDNHFYNIDSGTDPLVYTGWNVTTMRRHIINLQAYAGRKVQLAIADIDGRTFWKAANFDSLEVNINPTSFKVDTIVQNNNEKTFYCAFADKYVSSNHFEDDANGIIYKKPADKVADTTDVKAAADFLSDYYGVIRNTDNGTSFCGVDKEILTSDPVKGIVTSYNNLTVGAQKIVCASTDYQQGTYATKDTWFEQSVVTSEVGTTLEYIASYNKLDTTIYGNLAFFGNNTTAISVTVFAGIAGIGAVIAFLLLKRRKEKAE